MSSAKNRVLDGFYKGDFIRSSGNNIYIDAGFTKIDINKKRFSSYELLTEDKVKSGTSAILRGAIGVSILGAPGILAALTAKDKSIYLVALEYNDGGHSIIEVDERLYKLLIRSMF